MARFVACAACVVLLAVPARAQTKAEEEAPEQIAETFLSAVQKGQVDQAVDSLPMESILRAKTQELEVLKTQTKALLPIYGTMLSYEKIRAEPAGASVVHLVYLAKHEKHPVSWRFVFYKAKGQWEVAAFKWSDSFEGLFR